MSPKFYDKIYLSNLDYGESEFPLIFEKIDTRYGAIARFSHKTTLKRLIRCRLFAGRHKNGADSVGT